MGNRAVVGWIDSKGHWNHHSVGVYLHWNGGRDSIEAFLAYCKACGFRSPTEDDYGLARFVQVVVNFFGPDGLSTGVNRVDSLDADNGDNGLYICRGWEIFERQHFDGEEQQEHDFLEMLKEINIRQPKDMQLSDEMLAGLALDHANPAEKKASVFAPEDM